ncbi:hypothetical protein BVY01_00095 [bacterium I07]|nr:hypothetical protein BVY01_00095 [bacterium I07]
MTLVRYNPHTRLTALPNEIERFFRGYGLDSDDSDTVWNPIIDLSETETSYEIKAEMPGLNKKDIQISFKENVLSLTGEKKGETEEKEPNYHRLERSYGKFERSFRFPKDVKQDSIKASFKNGVLTVEIPKAEEEKPRAIAIS